MHRIITIGFVLIVAMAACLLVYNTAEAAVLGDRILRQGMQGEDVAHLQTLLRAKNFDSGQADGIFGPVTLSAVLAFQRAHGLTTDGIVGSATLSALREGSTTPARYRRVLTMRATAYSSQDPGVGNRTYSGHILRRGLVAVDPRVIPLGSSLYVEGYGYAIADDTGGAIKGDRIDLAFETRREALNFGVKTVRVYIL